MKSQKIAGALMLVMGIGIGAATPANAEVKEECILTGEVEQTTPETLRVTFTRIEHGTEARCQVKRQRRGLDRMQFEPQSERDLAQLEHGALVRYRYQQRNGEHFWQRIDVDSRQVTQNSR